MKTQLLARILVASTLSLVTFLQLAGTITGHAAEPDPNTKVYWNGGKRGHIDGCPRLPKETAELAKIPVKSYGEMTAGGAVLCSRCPGSSTQGKGKPVRKADAPQTPAVVYDPGTKVYVDALWFRVHAEDCPSLLLKERKRTLTLEEADKAGCRIGQSGQSGRENCCLQGYRRKRPEKKLSEDTILCGNNEKRNFKHIAGCHRYWPVRSDLRRPLKDWVADGFKVCPHCIERGPGLATITDEEWKKLGPPDNFVAPEGWVPKPYSADQLPPASEVDILIKETLSKGNAIQELPFTDPVACMEMFMGQRFFFPVTQWLNLYQAYRSTGDRHVFDMLLESARHYNRISMEYPSVAQLKASDPEGIPFMYSMAACARITLQLAKKHPDQVGANEIEEAETFLRTIISVLKPVCEGDGSLDPEMGIPRKLADDFRSRAYNRAMNGIGTLGMTVAALEDLQSLRKTKEYQPTIDRYRKVIREFLSNFFNEGHLCTKVAGRPMFVYPYNKGKIREVNGCPIFKRPEDGGHYSHTLQGLMLLYQATPELGTDDEFMTAVANAIYRSSTEKVPLGGKGKKAKGGKKETLSGHVECPTAAKVRPFGSLNDGHTYSPARERFYMLEAFRDGIIDAQCITLNAQQKEAANSDYDHRLATLFSHYMKALRKDRSLIHLREETP